ncbi:MAG: hypothetical protein ACI84O_000882 [Myxococcota bacterium]|jgi:hypothetical protein
MTAASAQDWVTDYTANGVNASESFATSIISIDDINDDGHDDFVVSSPSDNHNGLRSGSISILSGVDASLIVKRDGELYAERIGTQLTYLGTHAGDQKVKFAASAPFFDIDNGSFSGVVRIYAYDLLTSTLELYTTLEGPTSGQMFGIGLASYQYDDALDNDLELAVGAIGHNLLDGAVYVYQVDSNFQAANLIETIEGASGQQELLGYSLSAATLNGESSLLMGSPFANDGATHSGAVSLIQSTGGVLSLQNPFSGVANANLGVAVAAGEDVTGDGIADFIAGSPYLNDGYIATWSNSASSATTLAGTFSNERFGFSIAMVPDINFDGVADVLVGAPEAASNHGRAALYNLTTAAQSEIVAFPGSVQGNLLGTSVASAGDVMRSSNNGLFSPVLIGAIGANDGAGELTSLSPNIKDIALSVGGSFEWYTDITLDASNLANNSDGTLYWYMGTQQGTSTSSEGFELNIAGNVQLITSFVNPGSQASQAFAVPDTYADGQILVFQLVEERGFFIHNSNVVGGQVSEPPLPFELFNQGDTAGQVMTLSVVGATPSATLNFYGTANPSIDPVSGALISSGTADADGELSVLVPVPASFSGVTGYLRAQDLSNSEKTQRLSVTFN